jgi:aspartyl-tRNA(Asn)/glutamyl-tRNA(Gln) amidotransferase subunit C
MRDVQVFGYFGNGTPWNSRNDRQRWVWEFRTTPFPKQRYTGSLNKNLNVTYVCITHYEFFMKISEDEVRYVAKLARLDLDKACVHEMSETLSEILTYMDILNELDTSDVPPTSYVGKTETVFRKDEVGKSLPLDEALQNAPDRVGAFFRVPKIIE